MQKKSCHGEAISWKIYHWNHFCGLISVGLFLFPFFSPLGGTQGTGSDESLRRWADLSLNPGSIYSLCDLGFPDISKQLFPNIPESQFSHLFPGDKNKIPLIIWIENWTTLFPCV